MILVLDHYQDHLEHQDHLKKQHRCLSGSSFLILQSMFDDPGTLMILVMILVTIQYQDHDQDHPQTYT
ncbi:hypothetical protein NIES2119_09910 [[Phormidium ambiguum] IAM M-71]|uniref:Uncharacterized protein n=1 Tax=[Phormidium ambiguum] IAM M-71 TaxID=454136 RepID=A0A1U7IM39_9CYAN|nr:hypothetical protein NIES2119_09910 [Phormidium ambiguum IAM M-71]